jgi:cysteine dioxygenase
MVESVTEVFPRRKPPAMLPPALADVFEYLESCTGPVELGRLEQLLRDLKITRHDIESYVQFNDTTYRRNQIRLSRWYEALIICWGPGQKSYIHDHHGSSCCFRVIEGSAKEIICKRTGRTADLPLVRAIATRSLPEGFVCGSSSEHIHEVINDTDRDLITLHVYSPPLNMRIYSYDTEAEPVPSAKVELSA